MNCEVIVLSMSVCADGRRPRGCWRQPCTNKDNSEFDERQLAQLVRQNMRANNVYAGLPTGQRRYEGLLYAHLGFL